MNPASFSRFFRKMTGRTFVDQRNAYRVCEACRLLAETDLSIVQVAYEAGFGNLSHFNRVFRKDRRLTPRRYRSIAQGQA